MNIKNKKMNYDLNLDIDSLLKYFSGRKAELVEKYLKADKTLLNDILIDQHCLTNLGNGIRSDSPNWVLNSYHSCFSCANIGRLVDLEDYQVGKSFTIEGGSNNGKKLIVYQTPDLYRYRSSDNLKIFDEEMAENWKRVYKRFINNTVGFFSCCPEEKGDVDHLIFYHLPPFFNDLLVSYYIEHIYGELVSPTYDGFVCGDSSYKLMREISTPIDIKSVELDVLKSTFFQLINILRCLQRFHFSHGNPVLDNLLLIKRRIEYVLNDGNNIEFKTQLQIRNFYNSSITTSEKLRIGNMSETSMIYVESYYNNSQFGKNKIFSHTQIGEDKAYYLKFTRENRELLYHLIKVCLPVYNGMFDFYCFVTSFMCQKEIYEKIESDQNLLNWYKGFFLPGEYPIVIWRISEQWKKAEPTKINDLLYIFQDIHLRCDILDNRIYNFPGF